MLVVLIATAVLTAISILLFRCNDPGKAGTARTNWNAPRPTGRMTSLDDLTEKAITRGRVRLPDARLSRIGVKRIDLAGMVHLDAGGASFELVGPAGSSPCGVHLAVGGQGWSERKPQDCTSPPLELRCRFVDVVARAFPDAAEGAQVSVVVEGAPAKWTLRMLDVDGARPVDLADDC
jgi:hypothetical protein